MTALKEYQRLETFGLWHAAPDEQRREVIVSLGDATLTISDPRMQALSHWSLPAVMRLNPGERPACYGPGPDQPEVLELEDETMIAAIEKVRGVIGRRQQPPRRLRNVLVLMVLFAVAVAAGMWLPGALIRQAVAVVPAAQRSEVGAALLAEMRRVTGSPCDSAQGRRALDRLRDRLLPGSAGRLVVVPSGVASSAHLPGGIVVLNRALVEDHDEPAVVAGHVLAEDEAARQADPLGQLLHAGGVLVTVRLLATGQLSQATLAAHAERLLGASPLRPADEALLARFSAAQVPSTPYARALDITGETTLGLIEGDPVPAGTGAPILSDDDWVGLQGICGG
jgi:hypothetical protein